MRVGIPTEIKNNENRVAITQAGVFELERRGHEVLVQAGAGLGSAITDAEYAAAGATIVATADEVWDAADMILKVKEPIASEYPKLRKGQVLFTYLHLAAERDLTEAVLASGTTAIAYETVQLANRTLPLLAPMSEVAGRLSVQVGAYSLMKANGGRGILLGGVTATRRGKVVVIGGGAAGEQAARIAFGMGAEVTVLSHSPRKREDALRLGAHDFVATSASDAFTANAARFDFILDTVSAPHDYNAYLGLLKRDRTMVLVGVPDPTPLSAFPLVMGRRRLAGSLIGGIAQTQEMLDFCGQHGVVSDIELIAIQQINEAWDRVVASDVRYRFVIDLATLPRE